MTFRQIIQLPHLSLFYNFIKKEENKINQFIHRHEIYLQFDNSSVTSTYYASG